MESLSGDTRGSARAVQPATLFNGNTGGWWDPADLSTLFQDSAGTTPVTAAGQPVGRMNDKSGNGNHLLQPTSGKRPLLQTGSGLWWLAFDGVDDDLTAMFALAQPVTRITAARNVVWSLNARMWDGGTGNTNGLFHSNAEPRITMYAGTITLQDLTHMTTGVNHVVTEQINGTSSKLGIDDNSYVTANAGTNNPGGERLAPLAAAARLSPMFYFSAALISAVCSATPRLRRAGHILAQEPACHSRRAEFGVADPICDLQRAVGAIGRSASRRKPRP